MKKFNEKIYFHRDKDDNSEIRRKAERKGFSNSDEIRYLGYEVEMEVEITENDGNKVLSINGIDVADKEIYI